MSQNEYKGRGQDIEDAKELAEAHWQFISKWFGMIYKDSI
jgi:hypothetical protein